MIRGITVRLWERTETGTDAFGAPTYAETPVDVPGVLVTPVAAEDVIEDVQLYGKHSVYELSLPKGDTHRWEDSRVAFFGETFRVFGPSRRWIDANVPGPWNEKWRVERYA